MHVKKGDTVKIIAGKDRVLPPAKILAVDRARNRVIVEGRNLVKKHRRGNAALGTESRIEETEAFLHASNVMLWSEKLQKPVRTQKRFVGAAGALFVTRQEAEASFENEVPTRIRKVRFSVKSEEIFD